MKATTCGAAFLLNLKFAASWRICPATWLTSRYSHGLPVCVKGKLRLPQWEDFDGDCIRLRAEDAKNGTARLVPLEGELVDLIERRKTAREFKDQDKLILSSRYFIDSANQFPAFPTHT
jgi:integrase